MFALGAPASAASLDEAEAAIRVRDYAKAASILQPLTERGDAEAQYQLAGLYRSGRGVSKDHKIAFELLRKAASQGHVKA
ncbi:MAG: hypothetical protein OEY16_05030, partial [Alphaproteobacteria bacterium]|nr:hypothetical protein [Alphaproteobacteria bacterium]